MISLSALTLNVHKGFSHTGKKFVLNQLRNALREENADLIFLQEVVGENKSHEHKTVDWPSVPQYEFLADEVWSSHSYARNAVYQDGHHGNAILSRYPIISERHHLISANPMEQRGILHAEIELPSKTILEVICVHLGLLEKWRMKQIQWINQYLQQNIHSERPLLLAGDFNDWRGKAGDLLLQQSKLTDPYYEKKKKLAKTYPAIFPILAMDRMYYRNMAVKEARRLHTANWRKLSDHLPLVAEFAITMSGDNC